MTNEGAGEETPDFGGSAGGAGSRQISAAVASPSPVWGGSKGEGGRRARRLHRLDDLAIDVPGGVAEDWHDDGEADEEGD